MDTNYIHEITKILKRKLHLVHIHSLIVVRKFEKLIDSRVKTTIENLAKSKKNLTDVVADPTMEVFGSELKLRRGRQMIGRIADDCR